MQQLEGERFVTLGNRVAWSFVPFVAICQALQLAFPVPGVRWLSFEVVAYGLLAMLTAPWWWRRRGELSPTSKVTSGAFVALVAYAFVTVLARPELVIPGDGGGAVPRIYTVIPLFSALFATAAGFGFVLAAERHLRLRILAWGGGAAVVVALVGWPFQSMYRGYIRLATGQGGAAIVHVMFMLIAAFGLACFIKHVRPRASLALALGAFACVIATQSRGGLVAVTAWLGLVALGWLVRNPSDTRRLWPIGAGVVAAGLLLPFIPGLDRVLSFEEPKRLENITTGLAIWGSDTTTTIFGAGSGQVWPWWAYESGRYSMPGEYWSLVDHPAGELLMTPHSTPLAMLVELGLPGALLGLVMGLSLTLGWWRSRTTLPRLVVASATLACLVAFLVDTYLLRNFGISMWWWGSIALVATWSEHSPSNRGT